MELDKLLTNIQGYYIQERLDLLDKDFLAFEEKLGGRDDLEKIYFLCENNHFNKLPNPHNSCLLYVTGLTSEFNPILGRADTTGGSPPD